MREFSGRILLIVRCIGRFATSLSAMWVEAGCVCANVILTCVSCPTRTAPSRDNTPNRRGTRREQGAGGGAK